MKRYYIAGNWKMHKTISESVSFARTLVSDLNGSTEKLMIAPPFTALAAVYEVIKGTNIILGAQNMGPEESGAHTGEISILMLKDLGVKTVILGHSERRHSYNENDTLINRKVRLAINHEMEIILCVGETLREREAGRLESVISKQIMEGLSGITANELNFVTIAYEPVWAIGTGKNATPEDADTVHAFIRTVMSTMFNNEMAKKIPIQYGGSVKPDNIVSLMAKPNIDGALVGGASLKAETFIPIARFRNH